MIGGFFSILLGTIIFFPFIVTLIILIVYRRMGIPPALVLGQAADLTTPLLFLSVYFLSLTVFGESSGFYMVLASVVIVITYTVIERMRVKEFRILRLLRKTWRLYFLILTSAYVVLFFVGTISKIIAYTR